MTPKQFDAKRFGDFKSYIFITSQFEGFHRWKDAPNEVDFLRNWHRHIFFIKVFFTVRHTNRDIEFFQVKKELKKYLDSNWENRSFDYSCEQIALLIAEAMYPHGEVSTVQVSEDGENGAAIMMVDGIDIRDIK